MLSVGQHIVRLWLLSLFIFAGQVIAQSPSIDRPAYLFTPAPDDHILGAEAAPHTLIVYASVSCPHCAHWFVQEWPQIKDRLIKTNRLRFVFREFPTEPVQLAMTGFFLANCAETEAGFFASIEYQMQNQSQIFDSVKAGHGRATYDAIAARNGLDEPAKIEACFQRKTVLEHIQRTYQRAEQAGIRSVPSFILDGAVYEGGRSASELIEALK